MGPTLREILRDAGEIDFALADPTDLPAASVAELGDEQDPDAAAYAPHRSRRAEIIRRSATAPRRAP